MIYTRCSTVNSLCTGKGLNGKGNRDLGLIARLESENGETFYVDSLGHLRGGVMAK